MASNCKEDIAKTYDGAIDEDAIVFYECKIPVLQPDGIRHLAITL